MMARKYNEIHRLHEMLTEAGIEHEWVDRTPPGWNELVQTSPDLFEPHEFGWQIIVYESEDKRLVSAVEGWYTYGGHFGRIEIVGLTENGESVEGWLTAEEVFARVQKWRAEHGME